MQNNIKELTQKLLRALDSNYNVIDMATVIEVLTLLENVSITKELLETTRLGKHINELRKNIPNELAKRAKALLKNWRDKVLKVPPQATDTASSNNDIKLTVPTATTTTTILNDEQAASNNKKRFAKDNLQQQQSSIKRTRVNGVSEYEFSDNSNSSMKDALIVPTKNVILINSDSNSSLPDVKHEPLLEEQQPKKRGRKKGSKNHKNLLDEAETSFTNKMAVSRGAKVKTTQELIAGLQNKQNHQQQQQQSATTVGNTKNIEDWNERAAKLKERVNLIDQKLNTNINRKRKQLEENNKDSNSIDWSKSPSTTTIRHNDDDEDDIVVVVDDEHDTPPSSPPDIKPSMTMMTAAATTTNLIDANVVTPSLSIEEAMKRLPPIDHSRFDDLLETNENECICALVDDEFITNPDCQAQRHLANIYRLNDITTERIDAVHKICIENVNGNFGMSDLNVKSDLDDRNVKAEKDENDDKEEEVKIVPNFYELSPKDVDRDTVCENYKKYCISDCRKLKCDHVNIDRDDNDDHTSIKSGGDDFSKCVAFREYHQVLDRPSYNGDVLRILPYVIID